MLFLLAWVACLRGCRASVDGVLAWVAWVACLRGWRCRRASVGWVGEVLAWMACYYYRIIIVIVIIEILS